MPINIRLDAFCLFFLFFFAFTWNKISDVIGLNRLYVGLHLDQQSSEPVHLKNDKIKIILLNSFLLITKSETTMSA